MRIYHRITFLPLLYMVHPKLVNNLKREKVYIQSQWLKNQVHQQPFCGVRAFRVREREREGWKRNCTSGAMSRGRRRRAH